LIHKIVTICSLVFLVGATAAHADTIKTFVGSQSGECCFNVTLDQVSSTDVQVTVSLTDGATYFAQTGGPHVGFAFNLDSTAAGSATIADVSAPWTLANAHNDSSRSSQDGTFNFWFTNPGTGTHSDNGGPLTFDVLDASGISISDFIKSTGDGGGYYFAADFLGNNNTGESGISCDGTITHHDPPPPTTPEPSSLLLLGTGLLGAAGLMRRRMIPAATRS
jgi:hypothetical protein